MKGEGDVDGRKQSSNGNKQIRYKDVKDQKQQGNDRTTKTRGGRAIKGMIYVHGSIQGKASK